MMTNGGKLKIMTGPHCLSQALNMASISSSTIELWIADHSDPHLGPPDHNVADEAFLDGIVSRGSGQSSRQASQLTSQQASQGAPLKVLTRPVSSGKDPAAGFTFTKAKPVLQLDFRRPKQKDLPPSRELATETHSHQLPPLPDTYQAEQNHVTVAAHQGPLPEHHATSVAKDPFPVPFPKVPLVPDTNQAGQNAPSVAAHQGPLPERHDTDTSVVKDAFPVLFPRSPSLPDTSHAGHNSLSVVSHQGLLAEHHDNEHHDNDTPVVKDAFPVLFPKAPSLPDTSQAGHNSLSVVSHQGPLPELNKYRSRKASRDPLTSVAGAPKITKNRRKKAKMISAMNNLPPQSNSKDTYTEDDLLKLLTYRRKQRQQELAIFRATQHQKEAEIQQLRDMSNNLYIQLQEMAQREAQKSADLSKLEANQPIWESKIKRLIDFAKGLANDQKRQRQVVDDFNKELKDVAASRKELYNVIQAAQMLAEQERFRSQQFKDDARHRVETVAQTLQRQIAQLRSDESSLMVERQRSNRLEDQICRITASHGQLLELFTSHRDAITGKIDDMLQQAQSIVPLQKASEPDRRDTIGPMLEQCVSMLQKLHKADTVKPEDLRKLNVTMDSFVQGYVPFTGRSNQH